MDIMTMIVSGALATLLIVFLLRLSYTVMQNLTKGRKFYHLLEQDFNKLRVSNMLTALGINKTDYIYQTRVGDIRQHMDNCEACGNTDKCEDRVSEGSVDIKEIDFCVNKSELTDIRQQQSD